MSNQELTMRRDLLSDAIYELTQELEAMKKEYNTIKQQLEKTSETRD